MHLKHIDPAWRALLVMLLNKKYTYQQMSNVFGVSRQRMFQYTKAKPKFKAKDTLLGCRWITKTIADFKDRLNGV